jgi:Fe-S-cluster containining protein
MQRRSISSRQNNFFEICAECRDGSSCCLGPRPPITPERRKTIEAYLEKEKVHIVNAFVRTDYVFPEENAEGYCGFYNVETATCLVHPVKPETCVAGPVTFDLSRQSGKVEWYIKTERICPLAGIMYKDKRLLQKHLEHAKKEILKLINGLDPKELEAILKKEEPDTFKIGEDYIRGHDRK